MDIINNIRLKADWVWKESVILHGRAPETRLASCLSLVEILSVLFYGGILRYDPKNPLDEHRDRLIASKGHGSLSLYPILADTGYFSLDELLKVGMSDSFLGVIPDTIIPGYETMNGSLGHGPGVACGMALGLKKKKIDRRVFVICGDGELNAGAVWEAVMFAAFHKLDNLFLIVDNNQMSMLGYQKEILGLQPLSEKFSSFGWNAYEEDGHDVKKLYEIIGNMLKKRNGKPSVLIANTIKARGIPQLEGDELCHVKSLSLDEVKSLAEVKK